MADSLAAVVADLSRAITFMSQKSDVDVVTPIRDRLAAIVAQAAAAAPVEEAPAPRRRS